MQRFTEEQLEGLSRRLRQGGCPVLQDHGYEMPPVGLAIEVRPLSILNQVCDLVAGGMCYVVEFALHNVLDRPLDVQGFQLVTPWGTPQLSLLPAPRKSSFSWPQYILPDRSHYFDADYMLNPIFARHKTRLGPDVRVQGLLVALVEGSIPEEITDRTHIPVTLAVFDSRKNRYPARTGLWVDRGALRIRKREAEARAERERELAERYRNRTKLAKRHQESQPSQTVNSSACEYTEEEKALMDALITQCLGGK